MVAERRTTNHTWVSGTYIKDVPLPIMRNICKSSFRIIITHLVI